MWLWFVMSCKFSISPFIWFYDQMIISNSATKITLQSKLELTSTLESYSFWCLIYVLQTLANSMRKKLIFGYILSCLSKDHSGIMIALVLYLTLNLYIIIKIFTKIAGIVFDFYTILYGNANFWPKSTSKMNFWE